MSPVLMEEHAEIDRARLWLLADSLFVDGPLDEYLDAEQQRTKLTYEVTIEALAGEAEEFTQWTVWVDAHEGRVVHSSLLGEEIGDRPGEDFVIRPQTDRRRRSP